MASRTDVTSLDRDRFDRNGYVVIRGLLSTEEAAHYRSELQRQSGLGDKDWQGPSWTLADGVTTDPTFQPLIFHPRLVQAVRTLLGPTARYTQHSDLHVHFGDPGWHRDSAHREFGVGPDWDESREPYRVARVAIYLHSHAESGAKLGVIPGTHRREPPLALRQRAGMHLLSKLRSARRRDETPPFLTMRAKWVATEPGDALIFDQRIYHSANVIRGPKYAIFLSYGVENEHSVNHRRYYMFERPDIRYDDYPSELAEKLREADLYLDAGTAATR
jgi:ectoine hydroxylase-related dioxygenase (phytanoyl-CoA dioxygenase family)